MISKETENKENIGAKKEKWLCFTPPAMIIKIPDLIGYFIYTTQHPDTLFTQIKTIYPSLPHTKVGMLMVSETT